MLVLYTLNLLLESHTIVHLKDGLTWSTLAQKGADHSEDLKCCEIHLAYVGRGLYIELIKQEVPLKIVESTTTTTSVIIGELTSTEEKANEDVVKLSLGVGIRRDTSEQNAVTLPSKPTTESSTEEVVKLQQGVGTKRVKPKQIATTLPPKPTTTSISEEVVKLEERVGNTW